MIQVCKREPISRDAVSQVVVARFYELLDFFRTSIIRPRFKRHKICVVSFEVVYQSILPALDVCAHNTSNEGNSDGYFQQVVFFQ